jgi:capsid protein
VLAEDFAKLKQKHAAEQAAITPEPTPTVTASSRSVSFPSSGRFFDGAKWAGGLNSGINKTADHWALRKNTRNMLFDSVQAAAINNRMVDNQIGTGLILESNPTASILGISEEEAEAKGDEISQRFYQWCDSLQSTLSETHNFFQLQHMAARYQHRDNDFLFQLQTSARRDLVSPLQVKIIDPDQLIGCSYTYSDGIQNNTSDGIERDRNGKEIAYWLSVFENEVYKQKRIPAIGARSGRRQMLHFYMPQFADQGTGFSNYAHALQDLEKGNDFALAHIMKAIGQSQTPIFVEPSKDADSSRPLDGLTSQRVSASSLDVSAPTSAIDDDVVQIIPLPEATNDVPGSMWLCNLTKGESIKPGPQNAPIDSYPDFMDSYTSYLSASMGMPIEVLLMRFGQNYSASRATLLLFWNLVKMWRANLVAQILHPVYASWFAEEIASGRLTAPGWSDPRLRAAWLAGRWNGTPMPNIDPVVTAKANELNAKLGATHLDTIARETNGSDGAANRAKLRRQYAELDLPPWEQQQQKGGAGDGESK